MGICFLALAVYVAYEGVSDLIGKKAPEDSIPGLALACVSLIVMPILFTRKEKSGQRTRQRRYGCRRQTDRFLCLPVSNLVGGSSPECHIGMVVGGPARGTDYDSHHREGRDRRSER